MSSPTQILAASAAVSTLLLLSACGGGGGGGGGAPAPSNGGPGLVAAPAAPVVSRVFSIKRMHVAWNAVPSATSYRLMRDVDGLTGFKPWGNAVDGAQTSLDMPLPVHLMDWANARYRLEACNSAGCTPSDTFFTTGLQQHDAIGYFKASNNGTHDFYGYRVALSGDGRTMAVGVTGDDSNSSATPENDDSDAAGAVFVYRIDASGAWTPSGYLKAGSPNESDQFGNSLSLSDDGRTLAVGAFAEDSGATGIDGSDVDETAANSGAVYVFSFTNVWTQQAYVKASNAEENDHFGSTVSLSGDGNLLAVGAPFEDSGANGINGNQNTNLALAAGAVYLFGRAGSTWSQQAYVKASNSGASFRFGYSLALSRDGQSLVVGSPGEPSGGTGVDSNTQHSGTHPGNGAAYVFRFANGAWAQESYLKSSFATEDLEFGKFVAIDGTGNTLVVSSTEDPSSAKGIDGDATDHDAGYSGAAWVFNHGKGGWAQEAYIKSSNSQASDGFGYAAALSDDGNTLAVSAPYEDSGAAGVGGNLDDDSVSQAGAVYVFTRVKSAWSQRNYVKASPAALNDGFGRSVSLSGDGGSLAVSTVDDSGAVGIGDGGNIANRPDDGSSADSGSVYLF